MKKQSAGILMFRKGGKGLEVLLVHPGGPFYAKKDAGVWSIPKGEFEEGEEPLVAAKREFFEEIGKKIEGHFLLLTLVKQKSGKVVYAWALEGDLDETVLVSNTFELEWPPKSGKFQSFPELDRAEWFSIAIAKQKIIPAQISFIDELMLKYA